MMQALQLLQVRRVKLQVSIAGHSATDFIASCLLNFTYTDHIDGKADDIQLTLHDREGVRQGAWRPEKGMDVVASIVAEGWFADAQNISLPCGTFKIDEVEFTGPPDTVIIKAVSASLTGSLRDTAKTRAFENTSLMLIAEQIATENELTLYYEGDVHPFRRQDQRTESDLNFLHRLAKERGLFLKVHDKKMVITDAAQLEQTNTTTTITRLGDSEQVPDLATSCTASRYTFKVSSSGTAYTHAEVAYTDPTKGQTHLASIPSTGLSATTQSAPVGKPLVIDTRVESPAEAITIGKAALQAQNAKEITASLELAGNPSLVAGTTVDLSGFGGFSGQYLIDKAVHTITGGGGYTTALELHKSRLAPEPHITAQSDTIATPPSVTATSKDIASRVVSDVISTKPKVSLDMADVYKERFDAAEEIIRLRHGETLPELIELMLCLPEIADAMANKATDYTDANGWLNLQSMFHHWFSQMPNEDPNASKEPYWIDWAWVMLFERAQTAYHSFTALEVTEEETHILNEAAKKQLAIILRRNGYMSDERKAFDFTVEPWQTWEDRYHSLRRVPRPYISNNDGLMATLGSFSLRALAKGHVQPNGHGGYIVHVTGMCVFVHDGFNFAEELSSELNYLGAWSCEKLNMAKLAFSRPSYYSLENKDFRVFRLDYDFGGNFLVLSEPQRVVHFTGISYYE